MSGTAEPCHRLAIRVYYEDTDAGGIVYYANYLRFAERGRTEWLRELGFENSQLLAQKGIALAVRRVSADYLRPARLDDALVVETRLTALRGASLDMAQAVHRGSEELVRMTLTLACRDAEGRARRLPAEVRNEMARFVAGGGGAAGD